MRLTRRESLAGALGLALAGTMPANAQGRAPSLNRLAARTGRRFGSAVGIGNGRGAFDDPRYRTLLTGECGLLVPENELKWTAVRPRPDVFSFDRFDRLITFAEQHRLAMRGHTLLWHHPRWFPAWVANYDFGANPRVRAEQMIREHVGTICRRYGTRIHSYDVVNEAVDNTDGTMRETAFSRAMGGAEPVLDLAFHTARETAPRAQLVYNDYMSWGPRAANHRAGVLRLLEGFRRRGTPVDALGIQAHIGGGNDDGVEFGVRQEPEWRRFLDQVTAMGYDLLVTELDVNDNGLPGDIAARDAAGAALVRAYFDILLTYLRMGDVLVWGMSDRYSWLQGFAPRADGQPKRACPYDADYRAKPMREALAAAFAAAPARRT
jgi:endo-1,4-beta-xylanase